MRFLGADHVDDTFAKVARDIFAPIGASAMLDRLDQAIAAGAV